MCIRDRDGTPPKELSLKEQLEEVMKESLSTATTVPVKGQLSDVEKTMMNAIKAEMQLFANTGNRGRYIAWRRSTATSHLAWQCLSRNAEHSFSAADSSVLSFANHSIDMGNVLSTCTICHK